MSASGDSLTPTNENYNNTNNMQALLNGNQGSDDDDIIPDNNTDENDEHTQLPREISSISQSPSPNKPQTGFFTNIGKFFSNPLGGRDEKNIKKQIIKPQAIAANELLLNNNNGNNNDDNNYAGFIDLEANELKSSTNKEKQAFDEHKIKVAQEKQKALIEAEKAARNLEAAQTQTENATKELEEAKIFAKRAEKKLTSEALKNKKQNKILSNEDKVVALAEKNLAQAKSKMAVAEKDFIKVVKAVYHLNYIEYMCYLATDLVFAAYQFKLCGESLDSFADAWQVDRPSEDVSIPLGAFLTTADTAWNLLMFTAHEESIQVAQAIFKKHKLDPLFTRWKNSLAEHAKHAIEHKTEALGDTFHYLIKRTHNLVGGAADILGINDKIEPLLGDYSALLYAPILYFANGYYSASIDQRYDNGKKVVWSQLRSLITRPFTEGEISRSANTFIRGVVSATGLRALGFTFIAERIKNLGWTMSFINPTAIGIAVFWHTLCSRFPSTYKQNFGTKDELRDLFVKMLIEEAFEELFHANEELQDEAKLSIDELKTEALYKAAGISALTHVPEAARLSKENLDKMAMELLAKTAYTKAEEYRKLKEKEMDQTATLGDKLKNMASNMPVAALRSAVGFLLANKGMVRIFDYFGVEDHLLANIAKYGVSGLGGLFFYMIYHNAATQNAKDKTILELFIKENPDLQVPEQLQDAFSAADKEMEEYGRLSPATIDKLAKYGALTISILSGVLRIIAQVKQVADPVVGWAEQKLLLTIVTLLLTEQSVNTIEVFNKSIEKSLHGYLSSINKCGLKKPMRVELQGIGIIPTNEIKNNNVDVELTQIVTEPVGGQNNNVYTNGNSHTFLDKLNASNNTTNNNYTQLASAPEFNINSTSSYGSA